jgi:hypothetical protein
MKNITKSLLLGTIVVAGLSTSAHATRISTGNMSATTTAASPLISNINATPASIIRFDLGGANYTGSGPLEVNITVDTSTPTVTVGTPADQSFKDDTNGAAFFGYYLSTGVRSSNQSAAGMNIKIRAGSGETAGRSYYLLGNGSTVPTVVGDLTDAPAAYTTFASTVPNSVHCGPSWNANGLTGAAINCSGGSTVANMDLTQFVRVAYTDPAGSPIVSQLEFIAVAE